MHLKLSISASEFACSKGQNVSFASGITDMYVANTLCISVCCIQADVGTDKSAAAVLLKESNTAASDAEEYELRPSFLRGGSLS